MSSKKISDQEAIDQNEDIQLARSVYDDMENKANDIAGEIANKLIQDLIKEDNAEKFNLTTALLAASKVLSHLTSFMYENENVFLEDVKKARETVVQTLIPALLDPHPCGICDNCKNGDQENCLNPSVKADLTTSRFLPILANMLIEYDSYTKVLWMHTIGKEKNNEGGEE